MLREVSDIQESDEDVWGCAEVSFAIETRTDSGDELIQRRYTFSHAPEWDKWTFTEFEEKRTPAARPSERVWRRSRHIMWGDNEAPTVDVPPEVADELEEMLGLEEIVLQTP